MKGNISPVAAGVIIAVVVAIALFFGWKALGPGEKVHEPANMAKLIEDVASQSERRADRERADPRIRPDATFHPVNPRMLPLGSIASFLPAATSRIWPLNQPLTPCWAAVGLLGEQRALPLNPSPVA